MEHPSGEINVNVILEDLGGCGGFQVILVILVLVAKIPSAFSMMLMSFGNYNPGWKCLDNDSLSNLSDSTSTYQQRNETEWQLDSESCSAYASCQNIVFNPDSITVVSEWFLVCDKSWIPSLIISIQMTGVAIGAYVSGYVGDKIGRKKTYNVSVIALSAFNLIAYFSTSWQMFAVLRFFIGFTYSYLVIFPIAMGTEYSTAKWRSVIGSIPAWSIGCVLFALCAMITRNWRTVELVTAVFTLLGFLPTLWVPESLRWMAINNKQKEIKAAITKIARTNQRTSPDEQDIKALCENTLQTEQMTNNNNNNNNNISLKTMFTIQAWKLTLIFTLIWFTVALIFFVISFGVKALSGDFYINLMFSFLSEIPLCLVAAIAPNIIGRKKATLAHSLTCTVCLISVVVLGKMTSGHASNTASLVLTLLAKSIMNSGWLVVQIYMVELYPTFIRSTCMGYAGMVQRTAGIVAPFLIPNDPSTHFISYSILAVLVLACTLLVLALPETKDTQLMDTWEESEKSGSPVNDAATSDDTEPLRKTNVPI